MMPIKGLLLATTLVSAQPQYIPKSAESVLGSLIIFQLKWEGHGKQRVLADCSVLSYTLTDISDRLYTAEPNSEMGELITQACEDIQWI